MPAMLAQSAVPQAHPSTSRCLLPASCRQGFYSVHTVPIIENTARECELTDRLRDAIQR